MILGDPPEEENALRGYSDIIKDADTQGVQKIPVSDILNYVGYDGTQGTIRLGTRARASKFSPPRRCRAATLPSRRVFAPRRGRRGAIPGA